MQIYELTAEWAYGDEKETILEKQKAALEKVGVIPLKEDSNRVFCTPEQAIQLLALGYCGSYFDVSKLRAVIEIADQFDVKELIGSVIEKTVKSVTDNRFFNEKCQQEQPSNNLLSINQTMLLEDACTDYLQTHIADGWRILAIQPQPNQRRPDYVLGRAQPFATQALRG
jgi:hypothetical protein